MSKHRLASSALRSSILAILCVAPLLGNSHRALLLQQEPDAQKGKLELTLSVQSAEVKVGQPILCKLTLSNTGTKAGVYDPQDYFPFRVLRSAKKDGAANRFIGSVAQTLGADRPIEPGASVVLWDKVDATEFLMPPSTGAVTLIVMVGAAPTARVGREQVTTPKASPHDQPVPVALTKPTPTGNISTADTLVAVLGPLLATFRM
jgi:hypothetical protein